MTARVPRPISAIRLDGGRLCVDFVNTIHNRQAAIVEDYLATPERYIEWARRSGALQPDEDIRLPSSAEARAELMEDVRALRDALYQVLTARLDKAPLPAVALDIANAWLRHAREDQAIAPDGQLALRSAAGDATLPLKRIALDLVDTLADADRGVYRLGLCANDRSCGWFFADTSKNRRRRWCAMDTCGVAAKMATLRRRGPAG
jgi:predicted RNA-binding Zn ribbon-like protein